MEVGESAVPGPSESRDESEIDRRRETKEQDIWKRTRECSKEEENVPGTIPAPIRVLLDYLTDIPWREA